MMIMTMMIMNHDDKDLLGAFPVVDPPCRGGGGGGGGVLPIDWSDHWTQWPCRPFSPRWDAPYITINHMSHRRCLSSMVSMAWKEKDILI